MFVRSEEMFKNVQLWQERRKKLQLKKTKRMPAHSLAYCWNIYLIRFRSARPSSPTSLHMGSIMEFHCKYTLYLRHQLSANQGTIWPAITLNSLEAHASEEAYKMMFVQLSEADPRPVEGCSQTQAAAGQWGVVLTTRFWCLESCSFFTKRCQWCLHSFCMAVIISRQKRAERAEADTNLQSSVRMVKCILNLQHISRLVIICLKGWPYFGVLQAPSSEEKPAPDCDLRSVLASVAIISIVEAGEPLTDHTADWRQARAGSLWRSHHI